MTETKPFKAADYLRDGASLEELVRYAAELEIENERLRAVMLRDWGVYELMRKNNNLALITESERRKYVGGALHLDESCSLLVGNLNNQRNAWLVISVLRGLRGAPSLLDELVGAA